MRKLALISSVVVLFATLAAGQVPTAGNVFLGYSYYNTQLSTARGGLNGFEGAVEGKIIPWVGMVADFSANYGTQKVFGPCPVSVAVPGPGGCSTPNANVHVDNFLFGPRVSVKVGKFRPFAEGLVGLAHATTNGFGSDSSISSGVGGGLDYHLVPLVSWRVQADYLHSHLFNIAQNNVRVSTGIVIHF